MDTHCDCMVPLSITGIYYINTNDGYTAFKDGDKVKSVANRIVLFQSMEHPAQLVQMQIKSSTYTHLSQDSRRSQMYKDILIREQWDEIVKWCDKVPKNEIVYVWL